MKKLIPIALAILLIASLGANAFQYSQSARAAAQAESLQAEMQSENEKLSADLLDAETVAQEAQSIIDEQASQIEDLQNDLEDTQSKYIATVRQLGAVMCTVRIPEESVAGVTTNQALIEPITAAHERTYSSASVNTTFELIWNNTKDAMFTVTYPGNESSRSVVTWLGTRVKSIYDISGACFYFTT